MEFSSQCPGSRLGGHEHIYTVVPKVFVLRMPIEVLEVIARTASKEAQESQDVEL